MTNEVFVSGSVVSTAPIVTFSKRGTGVPMGLISAQPDVFRGRKALHLIGLSFTIEQWHDADRVAEDFKKVAPEFPESRFVVLTNSEVETYLLAERGIAAMSVSQLIFINERTFRPNDARPKYDAIYNGRLVPFKRHELARAVGKLGLLYDGGPAEERHHYDEVRALLPRATFINHERGQGEYRHMSNDECVFELNRARVGLCLSAAEGSMRAAIEYLLCGLPVVSTRSIGGRDRYLTPPFSRIVEDDPEAVRGAVDAFVRAQIPKQAVRGHIMHLLAADRHSFLIAINKLVADTFGVADHFKSFAPFEIGLTAWRSAREAVAPLEEIAA